MAIIKSPNKSYTGLSASVAFTNGVGKTEDKRLIEWFYSHGYEIQEEEKPKDNETISLKEMNKDDLVKLAVELNVEFTSKNTKDELIALIKAKQEANKND